MQTFLPYDSFLRSAEVLDRQRLGKQRVEAKQIYKALTDSSYGWQNHPAVNMWRGYIPALVAYGEAVCEEWRGRGYYDEVLLFFRKTPEYWEDRIWPDWMGNSQFHDSHKSNLLRKNPNHYGQFGWNVPDNLEYVWPEPRLQVV